MIFFSVFIPDGPSKMCGLGMDNTMKIGCWWLQHPASSLRAALIRPRNATKMALEVRWWMGIPACCRPHETHHAGIVKAKNINLMGTFGCLTFKFLGYLQVKDF